MEGHGRGRAQPPALHRHQAWRGRSNVQGEGRAPRQDPAQASLGACGASDPGGLGRRRSWKPAEGALQLETLCGGAGRGAVEADGPFNPRVVSKDHGPAPWRDPAHRVHASPGPLTHMLKTHPQPLCGVLPPSPAASAQPHAPAFPATTGSAADPACLVASTGPCPAASAHPATSPPPPRGLQPRDLLFRRPSLPSGFGLCNHSSMPAAGW